MTKRTKPVPPGRKIVRTSTSITNFHSDNCPPDSGHMIKHAKHARGRKIVRTSTTIFQWVRDNNVDELIVSVEEGVPGSVVKDLPDAMRATRTVIADLLDISEKSIQRLIKSGLHKSVSRQIGERSIRLLQIRQKAIDVFESEDRALGWLNEPNAAFSGQTPLVHARTELGCRQIETVLDRIDHGVFS